MLVLSAQKRLRVLHVQHLERPGNSRHTGLGFRVNAPRRSASMSCMSSTRSAPGASSRTRKENVSSHAILRPTARLRVRIGLYPRSPEPSCSTLLGTARWLPASRPLGSRHADMLRSSGPTANTYDMCAHSMDKLAEKQASWGGGAWALAHRSKMQTCGCTACSTAARSASRLMGQRNTRTPSATRRSACALRRAELRRCRREHTG